MNEKEKSLWMKKGQLWLINGFIDTLKKKKEVLWKEITELEALLKDMINHE